MITTTIGSLCSGYGGLELAVESVLGVGTVRHVWHGEFDPDASAVLAANWPGVPNLGDITAVDFADVPRVDILCAGYPCQGESNAGLRRGADDPRHRWPDVARAIRCVRPRLVVLENVRGHLRRSFGTVLADLAALGYVGSWVCVRASDVGAPHRRERVVILAHPAADAERGQLWDERGRGGGPGGQGAPVAGDAGALLPTPRGGDGKRGVEPLTDGRNGRGTGGDLHSAVALLPTPMARDGDGRGEGDASYWERRRERSGRTNGMPLGSVVNLLPTPTAQNSHGNHVNGRGELLLPGAVVERWGEYAPAIARWEAVTGRPAPEPTEPGRAGAPRLSPLFVEWLMGLPEGWVTKHVERRSAALRILGNGAVPQQIAHALRLMFSGEAC